MAGRLASGGARVPVHPRPRAIKNCGHALLRSKCAKGAEPRGGIHRVWSWHVSHHSEGQHLVQGLPLSAEHEAEGHKSRGNVRMRHERECVETVVQWQSSQDVDAWPATVFRKARRGVDVASVQSGDHESQG
eukprot:55957-Eustigmatos_ZCMA.PRE.1